MVKNIDKIHILNKLYTSKCEVGTCIYKNNKYFYKRIINYDEYENYKLVKPYFKVPKKAIKLGEYILYEYVSDFEGKTLNDYLYGNIITNINFNSIDNQYQKSLNKTLKLDFELNSKSKKYFFDRLNILEKNLREISNKEIIFNSETYNLSNIFNDIILNIKKEKKLYSFVTQGDPTDTNITYTGYFVDFENSGYNTIISELSIVFVSLFSHGLYFYPKYNQKAYTFNKNMLKVFENYKPFIKYFMKNDKLYINDFNLNIPSKNRDLINKFIDVFLKNQHYSIYSEDFKLIKYYICIRLLTPIDIFKMNEEDRTIVLVIVILIYSKIEDLKDLKKLVN